MPNLRIFLCSPSMLLLPCMILASLFSSTAVASQIPLGSKLSVKENRFWVSSNGDFALGFLNHSDQPSRYSVGIRFNSDSIPVNKQTVVWVAGADSAVGNESYFQLDRFGELVLFDSSSGSTVWTSKTSNLSAASASLQDNGNFVITDGRSDIVWQSFDTPSDTLLPGQNLRDFRELRAASRNSMSSYYTFGMNESGQLQLKYESNITYWTSGGPSRLRQRTAVLNSTGAFQILDGENFRPVWSRFAEDHGDAVRFRFLRLDVDGNLRLYSWDRASGWWKPVWQAVENQCDVFATCGLHGICVYNSSGIPICRCPFNSATEPTSSDCLAPYTQECASSKSMEIYEHTRLYGMYPPNNSAIVASLEECRRFCEEDRLCTALTYSNDGTAQCRMKKTRYITGYSNPSLVSISFVKNCLDPMAVLPKNATPLSAVPPSPVSASTFRSYRLSIPCLVGAAVGTFIVLTAVQIVVGIWLYKRRGAVVRKASSGGFSGLNSGGLMTFSFPEVKEVADNFKHRMGPCSFKGVLPDGRPVLIKQLKLPVEERRFRSMAAILGSVHHKNLVKLEGYCSDFGHRFLAYEFISRGSLEKCMENPGVRSRLTWRKRMEICLSVARAMCYLHNECREFISHGNLSSGSVMLDENLEPKVSEFGLLGAEDGAAAGKDVKGYGRLVLSLFRGGCRRSEEEDCGWCYDRWIGGEGIRVVDGSIAGEVDLLELERVLRIVFWCLQVDERKRPGMGEVVKVLEGTLVVDPPPHPFGSPESFGGGRTDGDGSGARIDVGKEKLFES